MSEIFSGALEHFDARPWYHGQGLTNGCTCLWLAVAAQKPPGINWDRTWAMGILSRAAGQEFTSVRQVYAWNDAQPSRERVRAVLLRAAELERAES